MSKRYGQKSDAQKSQVLSYKLCLNELSLPEVMYFKECGTFPTKA